MRNDYSAVAWGEDNYTQPGPPPQVSVTSDFYKNSIFLITYDNSVFFLQGLHPQIFTVVN